MITVVIASFRYGHLASHCIESVLSQTRKPDNILFVDDGAGDCTHLPALYPQIEFTLREKNLGVVANFQDMLNKVQTEKVMFLGADNWIRSDTVEKLLETTEDIVTYDIIVTGEDKNEILKRHPSETSSFQGDWYWDRSSGHHGSMLYNVEMAKKVGGYAPSGGRRSEEDLVLYNRLLGNGATRKHLKEAFLYYRRHKQNFYQ